jgi:hypothetical protein
MKDGSCKNQNLVRTSLIHGWNPEERDRKAEPL